MESNNIDIKNLTKIPENEFKQHFRDWMEQDDVARSLQAKLRKDLIANFNKTSLGKKIILQTGVSHRFNLSPLLLGLNTLVAEFLYAQNCHFTLSVFCTEVPYRNTLPDFEGASHFRFSEREIFEIIDALSSNFDMDTKQSICKEYHSKKDNNHSLLFVVIKMILNRPKKSEQQQGSSSAAAAAAAAAAHQHPTEQEIPKKSYRQPITDKLNSKVECQSRNFRYLNKYLMILSKKMKEMSLNLDVLQKQSNAAPQTVKKSLQARKFESLNRNLEKISENLRHLSVSKRKNKRLSAVVTAVNTMAKQFEKCLLNFDQLSKGMARGGGGLGGQKSYSDWIHEMRTSDNGKLFLEKVESSLRKTLHRERKKMECELEQRMQIQRDILKSKYKHKLAEEHALSTSRCKSENSHQQTNEVFEKKLNEFEAKHTDLHLKIQETEKRLADSLTKNTQQEVSNHKVTQTTKETSAKPMHVVVNEQNQIQEMVKNISEQERQVDHIVFDAKLRVQELEHESNQLDRSFRNYLERQRSEKQKLRETATSIWQNYALGKSMLETKSTKQRLATSITKADKHSALIFDRITPTDLTIPTISIDDVSATSISPPVFENPFRIAKRKVLSRTKKTTPPSPQVPELSLTDTDSSGENYTTQDRDNRKQRPTTTALRLIEHKDEDEIRKKIPPRPTSSLQNRTYASKLSQATHRLSPSPELNIDDITLDGIELSPTTAKSSSVRSGDSNSSARGVFKLRRQLFSTNSTRGSPSTSYVQQMNSNDDNKVPKEPLPQINKHQTVDDKNKSTDGHNKDVAVTVRMNKEIMKTNLEGNTSENKASEVLLGTSTGAGLVVSLEALVEKDATSQSFHLNTPTITESTKKTTMTMEKKDST